MPDRTAVGRTTPPMLNEVEKGAIRRFAEAIGDYNPSYFDAEYARGSGFPGIVAPPSFPLSFHSSVDVRELLGVHSRHLLLADWTADYERPIVAGDRLFVVTKVIDIGDRPSAAGKVEIAVVEDEARDQSGHLVVRVRRTFVIRATREL